MAEDVPPPEPAANDASAAPTGRHPHVRILLAFLGSFVLLLVVFSKVLFPFLMAIYIAYMVEPIVQRVVRSRLLGVKWTRGPTIVAFYVVVLGGLGLLGWMGITKLAKTVTSTSHSISESLKEEGHKATFHLPERKAPEDAAADPVAGTDTKERTEQGIVIPKGTPLTILRGRYTTLYRVRVTTEERTVNVLLEHAEGPELQHPKRRPADEGIPAQFTDISRLTYEDGEKISYGDAERMEVTAGAAATGLEYFVERRFISPIVQNLAGVGFDVEPTLVRDYVALQSETLRADLPETIGKGAFRLAGRLVFSIYEFFLILMLTAFIVMDRTVIAGFFGSLPPARYKPAYQSLMHYIDDGLAGVIRGQLVICGVNGLLTYGGLLVIGVPYAHWLAAAAAVLSLIPVFGTIVSSIPIVLVAATEGLDTAIFALIWITIIHMLEANIFNPMIMGTHARMHPVIIIFSLLAGEHAFGIWGALLAVPTMSLIQSCFRFYLYEIEGLPKPDDDEEGSGHGAHGGLLSILWAKVRGRRAETDVEAAASGEAP